MASSEEIIVPEHKFVNDPIPESPREPQDASLPAKPPLATSVLSNQGSDDVAIHESNPGSATSSEPSPHLPSENAQAEPSSPTGQAIMHKEVDNQSGGPSKVAKPPSATSTTKGTLNRLVPAKQTSRTAAKARTALTSTTSAAKHDKASTTTSTAKQDKASTTTSAAKQDKAIRKEAIENKTAARHATAATKTAGAAVRSRPTPTPSLKSTAAGRNDTGVVQSNPKSPTQAVNLPSSLLAPTASYVSKTGASRQSISHQGGSIQSLVADKVSTRSNLSTATPALTSNAKSQPSSVSHGRPSIGPPPSKRSQQELSAGKRQSQVDEGFLARMMRPTQASSSKTSDKPPLTAVKKASAPKLSTTTASRMSGHDAGGRKKMSAKDATEKGIDVVSAQAKVPHSPLKMSHEASDARADTTASSPRDASGVRTPVTPIDPEPAPESRPTEAMTVGSATSIEMNSTMGVANALKGTDVDKSTVNDSDVASLLEPSIADAAALGTTPTPAGPADDKTHIKHEADQANITAVSAAGSSSASEVQSGSLEFGDEEAKTKSCAKDDISAEENAQDSAQTIEAEVQDVTDQTIPLSTEEKDATTGNVTEMAADVVKIELTSAKSP
ncbi:hypothetical protein CDD82_6093 [Ophiocordyceps australis]|uniref:Uncharacterized protein n=1 Tax=Ophiocordyceps australis TaxID=1399860 RepID=A0A2C5ZK88_9HYPO|nr:hypothetical protein CDD82_6093 [Ophiocordyceps australis]